MKLKLHFTLTPEQIKKIGNLICAGFIGGLGYLALKYGDNGSSDIDLDDLAPTPSAISMIKKKTKEEHIPETASKAEAISAIVKSTMTSYDKKEACAAVSEMSEFNRSNFAAIIAAANSTSMTSYDRKSIIQDFAENA